MGLFTIKKRMHELAYKINIPDSLIIHPVISVIHLKQALKNN